MWDSDSLARGLRTLGLSLLVTYACAVVLDNYPVRLNPVWAVNLSVSLVDNGFFLLAGVAFSQLAAMLAPDCHAVQTAARRTSALALIASLLFLALIPLQLMATIRSESVLLDPKFERIEYTRKQLDRLRLQVAEASSANELDALLRASQGLRLAPEESSQPFEQLQTVLLARIDAARQQLPNTKLERAAWRATALQRSLRVGLSALVTAIGLAALGRRRGSDTSIIDEVLGGIAALRGGLHQSLLNRREAAEARRAFKQEIRLTNQLQQQRERQHDLEQALLERWSEDSEEQQEEQLPGAAQNQRSRRANRRGEARSPFLHDAEYFNRIADSEVE